MRFEAVLIFTSRIPRPKCTRGKICTPCSAHDDVRTKLESRFEIKLKGYDMAVYVRRYSRYLNEKSASYRKVAYDFTRAKRKDDSSQSFKT